MLAPVTCLSRPKTTNWASRRGRAASGWRRRQPQVGGGFVAASCAPTGCDRAEAGFYTHVKVLLAKTSKPPPAFRAACGLPAFERAARGGVNISRPDGCSTRHARMPPAPSRACILSRYQGRPGHALTASSSGQGKGGMAASQRIVRAHHQQAAHFDQASTPPKPPATQLWCRHDVRTQLV